MRLFSRLAKLIRGLAVTHGSAHFSVNGKPVSADEWAKVNKVFEAMDREMDAAFARMENELRRKP